MGSDESPSLPNRLEFSYPSLPHPVRLVRLLGPIILIPICVMDRIGNYLSSAYTRSPRNFAKGLMS